MATGGPVTVGRVMRHTPWMQRDAVPEVEQ